MKKNISIKNVCILILVFLYPILPEYFVFFKWPIFQWLSFATFVVFVFTSKKIKDKGTIRVISIGILLMCVAYAAHRELGSIVSGILNVYIPILLIYNYAIDEQRITKVIRLIEAGGLILSLEAFCEYFFSYNVFSLLQNTDFDDVMGALVLNYRYGHARAEGSLGQAIPFATYLLFVNFFTIVEFKKNRELHYHNSMLTVLTYVFSLIAIFFTGSKIGILIAAVLQVFLFNELQLKKKVAIILILMIVAVFAMATGDNNVGSISDIKYTILGLFNSSYYSKLSDGGQNLTYRIYLFKTLSSTIKEHFLTGLGAYGRQRFSFKMITSTSSWEGATSIDDYYLDILVSYGFIGLISGLYPFIMGIYYSLKGRKAQAAGNMSWLFNQCLIMIVLYLFILISVTQLGEKRIFYEFVALILSCWRVQRHQLRSRDINSEMLPTTVR